MEDIFFVSRCDHRISNYELNIQADEHGDLYAELPFDIVCEKNMVYIRSWDAEQKYLESIEDYRDLPRTIITNRNGQKITGLNTEIGITAYNFVNKHLIKFDTGAPIDINPDLVPKNTYLLDAYADPKHCPRCFGTDVIKDININKQGKLEKVQGKNKIKQRVLKALMTPLGAQPYNETFGSELNTMVGQAISETTRIVLQKTIINCVNNLILEQPEDLEPEERIRSILGITLDTPKTDVTVLYVKVVVLSDAGESVDCSIGFNLGE